MRQLPWKVLALAALFVTAWAADPASAWAKKDEMPAVAIPSGQIPVPQMTAQRPHRNVMEIATPFLATAIFLSWVGFADWANRDSQIFNLGFKKWNPLVYFPFLVLALAALFIPMPNWAQLLVMVFALLGSSVPYIVVHNKSVQPHQTVLTGPWWRHFSAVLLSKLGVKMRDERQADYEKGAAVDLFAMGASDANADNANLLIARQSPGYLLVKDLIADMVNRRADRVHLEYGAQAVAIRQEIDGVWHNGEARDRESGDVMLAVMKTLANLDVKDRRKKQAGQFAAKYQEKKFLLPLTSQGVQTGERVILSRLSDKAKPHTYDALGMREGIKQQWEEFMARDRGFVVFSTLPGGGLTTLTNASIEETDRLMRDFFAIEEVNHREQEIQNVAVHTYDASKGETPATIIPGLIRLYPNAYIIRDLVDAESASMLMKEVEDDKLIITSIQAREAAEALLRILQMKVPPKNLAAVATAVLYERLIRKLCPDCKVGYTPPPDALKKLGIPPGKVQQLFRPPKPEEREKPCETCQGIGYVGRTGVFELLVVTDQMREILVKQPSLELLKKAARADGQRSLQEEGILLVAKGVTSLPELQRVLK